MATITGTAGNDRLRSRGAVEGDYVAGLEGNDTLSGGPRDTLDGGLGDDVYLFPFSGDYATILDSGGIDSLISANFTAELPSGVSIENLEIWDHAERAFGNELDNVITDRAVFNNIAHLDGADGDDTLVGNDSGANFEFSRGSGDYGNDVVLAGAGDDWLFAGTWSSVVIDFRDGTATGGGTAGSGSVRFSHVEGAAGGSFNDLLIAGDVGIHLLGNGGDDTLVGGAGDDTLYGGLHTDVLHGGGGQDFLISDGSSFPSTPGGDERLHGGAGNDRLQGGEGEDTLQGGSGADTLTGGDGADMFLGGAGNDLLFWDASDQRFNGGAGVDILEASDGDLDLTDVPQHMIRGIETIDLTHPSGSENTLILSRSDLLDLSPTSNALRIVGNASDSVDIMGSFVDLGVRGDFHRYRLGPGILLVDADLEVH